MGAIIVPSHWKDDGTDVYLKNAGARRVKISATTLTSGSTDDYGVQIIQTLNDSGAAGGSDVYRGIKVNITTTDITGWNDVLLMDLQDSTVSRVRINDIGQVQIDAQFGTGRGGGALMTAARALRVEGTYNDDAGADTLGRQGIVGLISGTYASGGFTRAFSFGNSLASTITTYTDDGLGFRIDANTGGFIYCGGAATGVNVGVQGIAYNSTERNYGGFFSASDAVNDSENVGIYATGYNDGTGTTKQVGGMFTNYGGGTAAPVLQNCALLCDNAAQANDIFVARDNGSEVFVIEDGGIQDTRALKCDMQSVSLADDAQITIATGVAGWGTAQIGDNQEFAVWTFKADGTVTLLTDCTANVVNTDTDTKFCIYDAGTGIAIKNRLGSELTVRTVVYYS